MDQQTAARRLRSRRHGVILVSALEAVDGAPARLWRSPRQVWSLLALTLAAPSAQAWAGAPPVVRPPTRTPTTANYGEPGLDIGRDGTIYATTPGDNGAVLAKSTNKGATWTKLPTARSTATQAALKGGDSDVAVAKDGTVFAADLNVDGITVFRSTDGGKTFPHQVFINGTSDREWLGSTARTARTSTWATTRSAPARCSSR